MLRLLCLIALAACVASAAPQDAVDDWQPPTPDVSYIDQQLDHFNFETQPQTFKQRVLTYDGYYDATKGGPLFMYTGNEGDIYSFYNNSGAVFEHAQRFGAKVVFPEHRFYGVTLPEGPTNSYLPGNVGALLVEQAVADYAELVRQLKADDTNLGQVIAFGGSYGGMLAAFSRMWYPQWFDGALAASAPLLISLDQISPFAFFEHITTVAKASTAAGKCPDLVQAAWAEGRQLAQAGNYAAIMNKLNLCSAPTSMDDLNNRIYMWARNAWTTMAMVNYPYATNFLGTLPAWPMKVACSLMEQNTQSPLEGLAAAVGLFYNGSGDSSCFNITEEFFVCADATGCGGARTDPNALSWDYQVCSEIVLKCGTNGKTDMFTDAPWSLTWLQSYCSKQWGVNPRPDWLPLQINLKTSTKIIYSNGLLDPWSVGGIPDGVPERDIHTVWIAESAHHLDLRATNPADPASVTKARVIEGAIIHKWLNEAEDDDERDD